MTPDTGPSPPGLDLAQLRRLTDISRALTYTTTLDQVTRLTVERGADLVDGRSAALMLADGDGVLRVRATHGVGADRLTGCGVHAYGDALEQLECLLDVPQDCLLAVPLVVGGAVSGLLAVGTPHPATAPEISLLSALADQAAVALESARLGGEVREEMETRLRQVEGATTAKDRALATLAHDIRTPLGAIDGYCEIMEGELYGPVTDRQRETLGRMRMSGRHLLSLLENVMEMARLSAGTVRVSLHPVPLALVARESVHMLLPAAGVKLQSLQLADTAAVTVLADHDRLRQVVCNLVGNAVKYTPADGSITVGTTLREREGAAWGVLTVTDDGPGIPAAERAAIFEPYYRCEGTAELPGVGLGLAISRALVVQMGGLLELESGAGTGSAFSVWLPVLATGEAPA